MLPLNDTDDLTGVGRAFFFIEDFNGESNVFGTENLEVRYWVGSMCAGYSTNSTSGLRPRVPHGAQSFTVAHGSQSATVKAFPA
eukprot:2013678-Rhodomonas_salina.5